MFRILHLTCQRNQDVNQKLTAKFSMQQDISISSEKHQHIF